MPAWVVPAAIAAVNLVGRMIDQRRQKKANKKLAEYQASFNEGYQQAQNSYNSPLQQMARYKKAGLNPNLIYSQGTPGNQSTSLTYPGIQQTDFGNTFSEVGGDFYGSLMAQTQMDATKARTEKTISETDLKRLEKTVMERNPLLDSKGFKAIIDSLVSSAGIKEQQLKQAGINTQVLDASSGHIVNKLFRELSILEDKHNLNVLDGALKAKVLETKGFQNDLLEIQQKWMTDAEITPQHIFQFIQAFLLKLIK